MQPPANWQHQQPPAFQPTPPQSSTNNPQHFFQPPPVQSYSQQNQISHGLSNARPPPPIVPMEKFQATNAFEKNTGTDGWDDWDWNDTSNNNNRQQAPPQHHHAAFNQQQAQHHGTVATNQSFPGPPLQQQYATQQQASMVINQSFPGPPLQQHQPQQPSHYSHPPPPAPHQQYQKQPVSQPSNIIDSFADNANWNWNQQPLEASNTSVLDNAASLFETVPKKAVVNHSRNVSAGSNIDFASTSTDPSAIPTRLEETIESRPPDDINNTQFVNPALKRVIKSEHQLTPQWSIESQMSHTSSERSGESDALDSRSTNTSDEQQYEHHVHQGSTNYSTMITSGFVHENECDQLGYTQVESRIPAQQPSDSLDEALNSLNINQSTASNVSIEDSATGQQPPVSNWQQHNFSLTPMTMAPASLPSADDSFKPTSHNLNANHSTTVNSSSSNTLVQNKLSSVSAQGNVEQIPPATTNIAFVPSIPTLPKQSYQYPIASTANQSNLLPLAAGSTANNPFKRTTAHKTASFPAPPVSTANYYQPPAPTVTPAAIDANQEQHENSETPDTTSYYQRNTEVENQEIAPHNDRNEYLQTGHLSEDGYGSTSGQLYHADGTENFPPPGLSRLVLGQPESNSNPTTNQPEPPRGLNRMVPGTDLSNSTHLNLERQADGQDTVTPAMVRLPHFSMPPPPVNVSQQPIDIPQPNLITTDRNLYLVPGDESDAQSQQRVVTGGLEQQQQVQPPIVSQQRELVMDGENLEDEQQQQPQIHERDEPIEGANMLDDAQSTSLNLTESEVNVNANEGSKKFTSNPSTCNDDSDKDRQSYFNRSSNRRSEESTRRRRGGEKVADRYETEESDYFSDRDKGKRRLNRDGREGSVRRDKGISADSGNRERDALRDQRESRVNRSSRDDRDRNISKRDSERYRRGNDNDKYEPDRDKYSRYETDGSRYETEDSRYDRQPRRNRGEFDARRDDAEKKYRRSDRGTDGRKRGKLFYILYLYRKLKIDVSFNPCACISIQLVKLKP